MTLVECFAWSALVVSAVSVGAWIVGVGLRRIGVSLGTAPALATMASIPFLTAAAFLPDFRTAESPSVVKQQNIPPTWNPSSATWTSPVAANETNLKADEPSKLAASPEAVVRVPTPAEQFWNWSAARKRVEPAFRAAAPWLAAIMLAGLAVGWLRLFVGWLAVQRLAKSSRPIDDAELNELFDVLRAELSYPARIELRECTAIASPAAVGWRKPAVLLPPDWRQWTESERRAVLAHELAHVKRGDFGAWMVAQACAAVHFFNPFVQGVSRWLRLEQECSADAEAARLAGGRGEYLRVLATLAVRQRDVSSSWPARCFLPTRGSFVRRIEMLRSHPPRWSVRTAAGNALLMSGVVAAGIALSSFRPALASTTATEPSIVGDVGIPIPQTAIAAGFIRVAEGVKHPQFGTFIEKFVKTAPPLRQAKGLKIEDVDRLGLIVLATDNTPDFDGAFVLVHKTKWDVATLGAGVTSQVEAGVTVLRGNDRIVGVLLDEKTIIVAERESKGEKVFRAMTGPRHEALQKTLGKAEDSLIAFATSGSEFFGAMTSKPNPGSEMLANFTKPIFDGQQSMLLKVDAKKGLQALIDAEYSSAETASTAGKTAEAGLTLLKNFVSSAAAGVPSGDQRAKPLKLAKSALDAAKVQINGVQVAVNVQADGAEFMAALGNWVTERQAQSGRMLGVNNLRQIGLAVHNYAAAYNRLPAAMAPEGAGKHPVSWRVRILPFIEHDALYREYRMNEPWDSEHNKKLLAKMPRVFASPVNPSATETPYQVFVGEATMFPKDRAVAFPEITDGTSRTIMAIETGKSVPWTKPEDIAFPIDDPTKTDFGGLFEGGFNVLMGDGSVQFFSKSIDAKVLRAIITRNGGEMPGGATPPNVKTPARP
jgi:beta-lactamase regulating signal transducer with metallopeptidase domain